MEILQSTYTIATYALLAGVAIGLLLVHRITPVERRLITATAVILAGLFFIVRPGLPPAFPVVGAATWFLGIGMFLRAELAGGRVPASRHAPWATLFLLPPAFIGALVLCGLAGTFLEALRTGLASLGG